MQFRTLQQRPTAFAWVESLRAFFIAILAVAIPAGTASAKPDQTTSYAWRNVVIEAGGFVPGLAYHHSAPDLLYARTDVGGVYRHDPALDRWIPLNDATDRSHWQWAGIASLALDPTDPDRIYLAAGSYPQIWGQPGAVLRSTDRGASWDAAPLPFKLPGNADSRGTGERLLVQPDDPRVLWLGSADDGLWRSVDRGETWSSVPGLPRTGVSAVFAGNAHDLFVAFVPGNEPVLWRLPESSPAWQPVQGQPEGLWLHRTSLDQAGDLYLAYANGPGPNGVTAGELWRLNAASGVWQNLTPALASGKERANFGFAGLAADPGTPGTLLVASLNRWHDGNQIWRTTDRGATWTSCFDGATWDHAGVAYTERLTPHWMADIAIDPHSSQHVWFVTGYGLWTTADIAPADGIRPHWRFANAGLEETVVSELISPPEGAHLLSAVGDLGGFRHEDLDVSPVAGALSPGRGSSSSIGFAGLRPFEMVRTHSEGTRAARSSDGGRTWTPVASSPDAARERGPGSIAINADASRLWWLPKGGRLETSTNNGQSWRTCSLDYVAPANHLTALVIADRADPLVCYVADPTEGRFWVSTDGGETFDLPQLFAAEGGVPRAEPREPGRIWVPTSDGLYVSTTVGSDFIKLPRIDAAYQLGFGRAAEDGGRDTVFLQGRLDGTEGVFRSDDSGATWVRIDDPAKRYGWIRVVIGDGQVRGRVYLGTSGRGIIVGDPAPAK